MDQSHLTYLDFELEIGQGEGRDYPVAVVNSPAGEARETMRFPYDELVLENRLKDLQIALLRSGGKRRLALSSEEQSVQDFGQDLFEALFTGEVRSRYDVSLERAWQAGTGIRLKLRIQSPELAALPWEFLYDPRQAEYVCLSRNTPVVRYLELPQPIPTLNVEPPLRILGMVASPSGLEVLDVAREKGRVERALDKLRARGQVELVWLEGQTWRDLQWAMQGGPWHVFHFIGHGGFDRHRDEGFIVLADEEGERSDLSATQLGLLLADHRSLRLALLNACEGGRGGQRDIFSSTASILVRRGIPAVLAMQNEVTDRAAIEVARAFYEALARGIPVDAAVAEARKAVRLAVTNTVEWGTPVLYTRLADGMLFSIQEREARDLSKEAAAGQVRKERAVEPWWQRLPLPLTLAGGLLAIVLLAAILVIIITGFGPRILDFKATSAAPPSDASLHDSWIRPADGMEMVYVPGGTFQIGSTDGDDDEQPVHAVTLDSFWIDRTEVTNSQYARCVADGACGPPSESGSYTRDSYYEDSQYSNYPVIYVDWDDANTYCRWAGGRLPTEAEWEYAARGKDSNVYPWGDEPSPNNALLNYFENEGDTKEVGSYPGGASWVGAMDMAGNVWEWVNDWYRENYYAGSPSQNPQGPEAGDAKVLRGGSWLDNESDVRVAYRSTYIPDPRLGILGFRCVVDSTSLPAAAAAKATSTPTATWVPPADTSVPPTDTPTRDPSIPYSEASLHDTWTRPIDDMVMVYVPGGTFQMGSTDGDDDEQPVHAVTLDSFWIDRTEVTNSQYARCVADGACDPPSESGSYTRDSYYGDSQYSDYPVIYVGWHDADTYCRWADTEGRLPTEAEWEYAARGPDSLTYPWGNDAPDDTMLNYFWHEGDTTKVDKYPGGASWVGAMGMAGNVHEWVNDWFGREYYFDSPLQNPPGPEEGDGKVARGGAWQVRESLVRAADRKITSPVLRYDTLGFRCCVVAPGE